MAGTAALAALISTLGPHDQKLLRREPQLPSQALSFPSKLSILLPHLTSLSIDFITKSTSLISHDRYPVHIDNREVLLFISSVTFAIET